MQPQKTVSKTTPSGSRYDQYSCRHNAVQFPLQFQSPSSSYASHSSYSPYSSQIVSLPSPRDRDLAPSSVYSKSSKNREVIQ